MDLINETRIPAVLFRSVARTRKDAMRAILVAKATFSIGEDGSLTRDHENPIQVFREVHPHPFGSLPSDMVPWKCGVDVHIAGKAYSPQCHSARETAALLWIGKERRELRVFGDRVWERTRHGLTPSEPAPFEEMPIMWERAFGGTASRAGVPVPYEYNPLGVGYVLEETCVEGLRLPNIENPLCPIRKWSDAPIPVATMPIATTSKFLADDMLAEHPSTKELSLARLSFNAAHPMFRFSEIESKRLELVGMTRGAPIQLVLKPPKLSAEIWLSDRHYSFPLRCDTLFLETEARRLCFGFRAQFTYAFRAQETRLCRLREGCPN